MKKRKELKNENLSNFDEAILLKDLILKHWYEDSKIYSDYALNSSYNLIKFWADELGKYIVKYKTQEISFCDMMDKFRDTLDLIDCLLQNS